MTSTGGGGGSGSGGRMWMVVKPHVELESNDIILSSSHTKELVSFFYQNFVFGWNKNWKFFGDIS